MTEHIAAKGHWSYACECIPCRWEQWWNEADNSVIPMPDQPHPDDKFGLWNDYFENREFWMNNGHPNR